MRFFIVIALVENRGSKNKLGVVLSKAWEFTPPLYLCLQSFTSITRSFSNSDKNFSFSVNHSWEKNGRGMVFKKPSLEPPIPYCRVGLSRYSSPRHKGEGLSTYIPDDYKKNCFSLIVFSLSGMFSNATWIIISCSLNLLERFQFGVMQHLRPVTLNMKNPFVVFRWIQCFGLVIVALCG